MKNKSIYFAFVLILVGLISSCSKDDTSNTVPLPDPSGTIVTTLDPGSVIVYSDLASDGPFGYYSYKYIMLRMGMATNTLNAGFRTDASTDGSYWEQGIGYQSGELSNLGTLDGLGYVSTKPASGYTSLGTIEEGHGYVIRFKNYFVNTPTAPYLYYRFYVVNWILNTSGGINGAKIKMQGPF